MKLLLDTHVLLWALSHEKQLSVSAKREIQAEENVVFVSLVSLWELQIKESLRKITLPANFYQSLEPAGFELLPVSLRHIQALGQLPLYHRDPFDRMLVVQAQCEQLFLVTRDEEIKKYEVSLLLA